MVAVLQIAQSCMCMMVGGARLIPLGPQSPCQMAEVDRLAFGAVGEAYARPCAR